MIIINILKEKIIKKTNDFHCNCDYDKDKLRWVNKKYNYYNNDKKTVYYKRIKKGQIIYVDCGVNIGFEFSLPHFAIALKNSSKKAGSVPVVFITSKKGDKTFSLDSNLSIMIKDAFSLEYDRVSREFDMNINFFESKIMPKITELSYKIGVDFKDIVSEDVNNVEFTGLEYTKMKYISNVKYTKACVERIIKEKITWKNDLEYANSTFVEYVTNSEAKKTTAEKLIMDSREFILKLDNDLALLEDVLKTLDTFLGKIDDEVNWFISLYKFIDEINVKFPRSYVKLTSVKEISKRRIISKEFLNANVRICDEELIKVSKKIIESMFSLTD